MFEYMATVERVLDSDTMLLNLDLGFHIGIRHTVRLLGIDAFETKLIRGATVEEVAIGKTAKAFMIQLLTGKTVRVKTYKDEEDKYGRYLCDLYLTENDTETHINTLVLEKGFGRKYEL